MQLSVLKSLFNFYYIHFLTLCVRVGTCAMGCLRKSEDSLQELVFSFYPWVLETEAIFLLSGLSFLSARPCHSFIAG